MMRIIRAKMPFVITGVALTFVSLQAPVWWGEREIRIVNIQQERDRLAKEQADAAVRKWVNELEFDEIIKYHAILPPDPVAPWGSEAAYVSDNQVFDIIYDIPDPVRLDWFETVLCDKDPHDGITNYEYWAEAESTGTVYTKPRARPKPEQLAAKKGFPINRRMPSSYEGRPRPIHYPEFDADCVLRSAMVMSIGDYALKSMVEISGPVKVRDIQ